MTAPCHHCGAPTADVPLTATLEGAPRPVCSSACQGTAEWIDAQGLSDYYRLRRGPSHKPDAESDAGLETVEYLVATNHPNPPGRLRDIASGGELARISLAIQVVAAQRSQLPCLILDEADIGVGGTTADVVGRMLQKLASHTQVVCVTHAPQVAALANAHMKVEKSKRQDTSIEMLSDAGRVDELARMLGGRKITDETKDFARTLLADAHN